MSLCVSIGLYVYGHKTLKALWFSIVKFAYNTEYENVLDDFKFKVTACHRFFSPFKAYHNTNCQVLY